MIEVTEFKDNFFSTMARTDQSSVSSSLADIARLSFFFNVNDRMSAFSKHSFLHSLSWNRVSLAPSTSSGQLGRRTGAPCGTMFTRFKNDNSPSTSKSTALPARKSLKERLSICPFKLGFHHKNTELLGQLTPPKDEEDEHGRKASGKR